MRRWFRDASLRSILRNTGLLGISKGLSGVAMLAVMALAARGLGATEVGWILLVHSYAMAASSLTHFQTWQLVVRYGSREPEDGNRDGFRKAVSFALGLDIASGIGGMLLAMALLPLLASWFGIPDEWRDATLAYCLIIPTMASAAANGVLRTLDRFDLISWQSPIQAYTRLAGVAVSFALDLPAIAYLAIWFVTDLVGDLYLWWVAWRELRRRDLLAGIRPRLLNPGLEGGWRFATAVNFTASVNSAWGPVARLLVGGLLSPAATSLYRIATSIVDAVQGPIDLLAKAVHPELMRHDPASARPWLLMVRTMILGFSVALIGWLLVYLFGEPLLTIVFGHEFAAAAPLLSVLMLLPLIGTLSFPLPAMFYSVGRSAGPLVGNTLGALIFIATLPFLTESHGLVGAGISLVVGRLMSLLIMALLLLPIYRDRGRSQSR